METHGRRSSSSPKQHSSYWRKDNGKCVIPGKFVVDSDLPANIMQLIETQGWNDFLHVKEPVYDSLVIDFYNSMKLVENDDGTLLICANVLGRDIQFDMDFLGEMFDLVVDGYDVYHNSSCVVRDSLACSKWLFGDESLTKAKKPSRDEFDADKKMLWLIVRDCLLPAKRGATVLTHMDCAYTYLLGTGVLMNLPNMVMLHMDNSKRNTYLPYGMVLTRIFKKLGLPLGGKVKRDATNTWAFDEGNLRREQLYRVEGTYFIKKQLLTIRDEDGEAEHTNEIEDESEGSGDDDDYEVESQEIVEDQAASSSNASGNIIEYLKQMEDHIKAFVEEQGVKIQEEVLARVTTHIDEQFKSLEERMWRKLNRIEN